MRRREFLTLLGGAAASCPFGARAQVSERVRRIGVLMTAPETDTELQTRVAAFRKGLEALGWIAGRNLQVDIRWGAADPKRVRTLTTELLGLAPDLMVVGNPGPLEETLRQSRSLPVLFLMISDPVEMGYVQAYAQP